MTDDTLQQTYKSYLDAYSDVAVDERGRLLRQSMTDDVVFTNPNGESQGFANLMEYIEQFQKKRKGASLNATNFLPTTTSS